MIDLTITEALEKLKSGEISATELTRAYLDRIEKYGDILNCYITRTPERALADAAAADARYKNGTARALDGIPIGMKDLFATRGIRTTAASHMLENFVPEYESTVSQKFIDSGSVLLGKTNLDEFAMGTFSKTSYFGAPVNPWQLERKLTAGGSSGGSTSAVAGGLAMGATGTDTGGSIRFPSAITGLVGMKPTYGLCSRWGCVAFASSLDTPGPIARTVDDAALLLSVMAGHDEKDSTSESAGFNAHTPLDAILGDGKKLRVGVIRELNDVKISDDMKKLFDARIADLKSLGAEIVEPITVDGVVTVKVTKQTAVDGKLEIDDAADDDADGGEQPRLADETPEDAPAGGSEGPLHTSLLAPLTGVHEQRSEDTEG